MSKQRQNSDVFELLSRILGVDFGGDCTADHQEAIKAREAARAEMTSMFSASVADMLIELEKTAFEFCKQGQSGTSVLLSRVIELTIVARDDREVMLLACKALDKALEHGQEVRKYRDKIKAEVRAEIEAEAEAKSDGKAARKPAEAEVN